MIWFDTSGFEFNNNFCIGDIFPIKNKLSLNNNIRINTQSTQTSTVSNYTLSIRDSLNIRDSFTIKSIPSIGNTRSLTNTISNDLQLSIKRLNFINRGGTNTNTLEIALNNSLTLNQIQFLNGNSTSNILLNFKNKFIMKNELISGEINVDYIIHIINKITLKHTIIFNDVPYTIFDFGFEFSLPSIFNVLLAMLISF